MIAGGDNGPVATCARRPRGFRVPGPGPLFEEGVGAPFRQRVLILALARVLALAWVAFLALA